MKIRQNAIRGKESTLYGMNSLYRHVPSIRRGIVGATHEIHKATAVEARHWPLRADRELEASVREVAQIAESIKKAFDAGRMDELLKNLMVLMTKTSNLSAALGNVVDLVKLRTGTMDVNCERFDLANILHEVSDAARVLVGNKPVQVMDISYNGPALMVSDPEKIRQIITHLVRNATQGTERGRIALILDKDERAMRLTIADTGVGIEEKRLAMLLQPPTPPEQEGEALSMGTGLGLRITRDLVQLLGGSMTILSKPGEGTIVIVSLPVEPPSREGPSVLTGSLAGNDAVDL